MMLLDMIKADNLAFFFSVLTIGFFVANTIFLIFSGIKKGIVLNTILSLFLTMVLLMLYATHNIVIFFALWEMATWLTYLLANNPKKSSKYLWASLLAEFFMLIAVARTVAYGSYDIAMVAHVDPLNLIMFCLPFIVKSGILPFNFWVADLYTGSDKRFVAYLSAIIGKLGIFGILRVFLLSPGLIPEWFIYTFIYLAGITAVWATFKAVGSEDAIESLSFSSLSQVAFIFASVLLMNKSALIGGLVHYLNHMLIKMGMFMAVVYIWAKTGTTEFRRLGDFVSKMPFSFLFFLMLGISLAGVPPMGGVISKWFMYEGFIEESKLLAVLLFFVAGVGSFLYVYRLLHSIFLGRKKPSIVLVSEMNILAILPLAASALISFLIGVYSRPFIRFAAKALGMDFSEPRTDIGFAYIGIVSAVFGALILFAVVLWLLLPKHRYVPDTEGYTAAAYLPKDIQHWDYSYNFYAPVVRLGDKFVRLFSLDWLARFWKEYIAAIGELFRGIYSGSLKLYGFYLMSVIVLVLFLKEMLK